MDKEELIRKVSEQYDCSDLDDHVHEMKSQEAATINNAGIDAQLEYLLETCGEDWIIEVFLGSNQEGQNG